jgi:hypothetical protein
MWLQQESNVRVWLHCLTLGTLTAAIITLTVATVLLIHSAIRVVNNVPVQLDATRMALVSEMAATRHDLDAQLDITRSQVLDTVNKQANGLRGDTKQELDAYRTVANARLGDTLARVDVALDNVTALRQEIDPALKNVTSITANVNALMQPEVLPKQVLGVMTGARLALGETAITLRTVQKATPEIVDNVQKASAESVKTSEQAAKLMGNLNEATKPLPKWMRVGLAIAPPLAQTAAAVASVMALTGILP